MRNAIKSHPLLRESATLLDKQPSATHLVEARASTGERPAVRGKFLFVGDQKYWVKGVTYGTFQPGADGRPFPPSNDVERDFAQMTASGINTVRVYTPPPRYLLDAAQRRGLRMMIG